MTQEVKSFPLKTRCKCKTNPFQTAESVRGGECRLVMMGLLDHYGAR